MPLVTAADPLVALEVREPSFSNTQHQQFNDARSDYQCNDRDVIVIEPHAL